MVNTWDDTRKKCKKNLPEGIRYSFLQRNIDLEWTERRGDNGKENTVAKEMTGQIWRQDHMSLTQVLHTTTW